MAEERLSSRIRYPYEDFRDYMLPYGEGKVWNRFLGEDLDLIHYSRHNGGDGRLTAGDRINHNYGLSVLRGMGRDVRERCLDGGEEW